MKHRLPNRGALLLLASLFLLVLPARAQQVYWTEWTSKVVSPTNGSVTGTITLPDGTTVGVTFTGDVTFANINGEGPNYWIPEAPYTSADVANSPAATKDIIAQSQGSNVVNTVTFDKPVRDVLFSVVSLNGANHLFNRPIEVLSYGNGYWGNGTLSVSQDTVLASTGEGHGTIRIPGDFTSFTFQHSNPEYWTGFTVGIVAASPEIGVFDGADTSAPELTDGQATAVDFGTSLVGVPVTRQFTIENTGSGALDLSGVTFVGAEAGDFSTSLVTASVGPGNSFTFSVTFTPGAAGNRMATMRIANTDVDENPFDVPLTGTGDAIVITPTEKISPVLDSLVTNCDGTYTAFFGYLNRNASTVTIPTGSDNRFSPAPEDRGQTTDFLAGRQRKVFAVSFSGPSNLVWTLRSPNGQQSTATAGPGAALPPQGCACQNPVAPSYAGGYVLNAAQTRAFVVVQAPEGATEARFYNTTNLVVGEPETGLESNTAIGGVTRSGNTFSFTSDPTVLYFPITTAGGGTHVAFFLAVSDACDQTVDVDPSFTVMGVCRASFQASRWPRRPLARPRARRRSASRSTKRGEVTLAVYDVLGREVARLVDGSMAAGTHEAVVRGQRVAVGSLPLPPDSGRADAAEDTHHRAVILSHTRHVADMNTQPVPETRKPFAAPTLRREARLALVTAGSFDLFIPNG